MLFTILNEQTDIVPVAYFWDYVAKAWNTSFEKLQLSVNQLIVLKVPSAKFC